MTTAPAPIPFDAFVLASVASELHRTALPARVQKITQPTAYELVLHLFGAGGAQYLYLSADPKTARVHLTQIRRENPITPPAFCQVCRKYLEGTFLETVQMPRFDRVLHLGFRGADGEKFQIVAELMGRNSNLILVSGGGLVRGSMRPAPPGSVRPLRPGTPYTDPPGVGAKRDPLTAKGTDDPVWRGFADAGVEGAAWLSQTFSGVGPFAAEEVMARARDKAQILPDAFVGLMDDVRAERFAPYHVGDGEGHTRGVWPFPLYSVPPSLRFPRSSVSVALDTFYQTVGQAQAAASEASALRRVLAREVTYREKEAASMEATLREAHRAEWYEQTANNLLAQLHLAPRGASSAIIADLYDTSGEGKETTVTLDPQKNGQENAQAYFARARKSRDAQAYAQERLTLVRGDLARLTEIVDKLDAANAEEIALLCRETEAIVGASRMNRASGGGDEKLKAGKDEKPFGGHKIRAYTLDGYELLVGETAEANDFLTTRVAHPADWWFHVRGGPGAHGILRTGNQPARVPDTILRRAAQAVAARSGTAVKHAGTVAVDMIEKRHVRKLRGAKPGLVTYTGGRERVLDVTPALP